MERCKIEHLLHLIKLNKPEYIQNILEYENIHKKSDLSSMQLSIYLIQTYTDYGEEKTIDLLKLIISKIYK